MKSSLLSLSVLLLLLYTGTFTFCFEEFDLGYNPQDLDSEDSLANAFESWAYRHSKTYDIDEERNERSAIFKRNLRYIHEQNQKNLPYKLGVNQFADLTFEERKSKYTGYQASPLSNAASYSTRYMDVDDADLPDTVDWREKGAVTPVKSQGSCGNCYAFGATAVVESINKIAGNELVTVSEQQITDCDRMTINNGCHGGNAGNALEYILKNGGIHRDDDYPYESLNGSTYFCKAQRLTQEHAPVVTIDGFANGLPDERSIKKIVAHQPVAVGVQASEAFGFYKSGVFTGPCTYDSDHNPVIVGYGTENGMDYWLVKNSWGEAWGDKGYIKMQRNVEDRRGLCAIATNPMYPTKKHVGGGSPGSPP